MVGYLLTHPQFKGSVKKEAHYYDHLARNRVPASLYSITKYLDMLPHHIPPHHTAYVTADATPDYILVCLCVDLNYA